jgi:O-antigen/teichoic acid export membrane protein
MSLKRNILANYVSQIYVTVVGIVMVPLYIKYMGAEAYGLVGFFVMLQAWFSLLDMGMTPTMARETARFNGGAIDSLTLRRLLRAMEGIFICIAVMGGALMILSADAISTGWLRVQTLPLIEVQQAIILMGLIIALRWISGLYRSTVNGFERLIWLSGFNILFATLRFILIIPIFIFYGASLAIFFGYQLFLAIVEIIILIIKTYRLLPSVDSREKIAWEWKPLKKVLSFSLSIAFTGVVWLLVTQTDKLILSKLLTLTDYAYFTVSVLVAAGVMTVSAPLSAALVPRLTKLSAEHDDARLIQIYRDATQLIAVFAIPVALVLAFFSEQLLWVWAADIELARKAAPVLTLYALGNGILALGAFPFYLQVAKGDLKLHMIGNALFLAFLIPSLILATLNYGMLGAGYAWMISNIIYFVLWTPKVHNRFIIGLHTKWLFQDIVPIAISAMITVFLFFKFLPLAADRFSLLAELLLIGIILVVISSMASSFVRRQLKMMWKLRVEIR